jgi:preprotein translocase subunit SecE
MPSTKPASATPKKRNAVVGYISDTVAELKKVTWLSRRELLYLSGLVLLVTIIVGLLLGVIDWGFSELINKVILGG